MLLSLNEALDEAPQAYWLYEYNRFIGKTYRMIEHNDLMVDHIVDSYDLIKTAIVAAENATVRQFPDLFTVFHRRCHTPAAFYDYLCRRHRGNDDDDDDDV
jgi:hypothetical protein